MRLAEATVSAALLVAAAFGTARADDQVTTTVGAPRPSAPPVDFAKQVLPIFQRACVSCHGPTKASGSLQLTSGKRLMKGGIGDDIVVAGHAERSYLVKRLLGEGGEDRMPLKAPALAASDLALVRRWIDEGAILPVEAPARYVPAPGGIKRLTLLHYQNTLRDLFGPAVKIPAELEPDTLVSGSATVGAARVGLSEHGIEKYGRAAFALADGALGDPAWRTRNVACAGPVPPDVVSATGHSRTPSPTVVDPFDDACARGLLVHFGRRAWRRPLADGEIDRYLALGRAASRTGGSFDDGLRAIVAALLQSPNFIYRSEIGAPDPTDPTRWKLTDFELAARLSYFLLGGPPDDTLLDAAQSGQLSTDAGLERQTVRLLRSPRAHEAMSAFFVELFRLRRLDRISESHGKDPRYTATLGASLRGETLRVIEEIAFDPQRDFREIFAAPFTYVNGELAALYGLPPPANPTSYVRVPLDPKSTRAGVLGEGSFLAIFSHGTGSSPTRRGKFIRETLLCQGVPPPPPDVETSLPKDKGGLVSTTREKLAAHRRNPRCAGCHKAMDPLGLAFEGFDGFGVRRALEAGRPVDTSGELDGIAFRDARGLGDLLRQNPKVGVCVARGLFRYALGHLESEGEEPLVEALGRGLERDGYRFPALVMNVIKSDGFRYLSPPGAPGGAALSAETAPSPPPVAGE